LHFSISFLVQHFHAGVNEWLTIRNLHFDIFRSLPIGRYNGGHGSSQDTLKTPSGPGVMRVIKGNIGAIGRFSSPCGFFVAGADGKKMLGVPDRGEGSRLFCPAVHFHPTTV
jgi:hypothetical protein